MHNNVAAFSMTPTSRPSKFAAINTRWHMVSIGLGPSEEQQDVVGEQEEGIDYSQWVAGVDYEIPNHEDHRLDRMTALDRQCDDWFRALLPNKDKSSGGVFADTPLWSSLYHKLTTPPPLDKNPVELADTSHEDWTPYMSTRLPWSVLSPAYGTEQFGLPTPRRNAEAWRQFDVAGLVSIPICAAHRHDDDSSSSSSSRTEMDNLTELQQERLQTHLQRVGGWLDNDECEARLIYVNGMYCPQLSQESNCVRNVASARELLLKDDDSSQQAWASWATPLLAHLPDGHTDALLAAVPMQRGAPSLTSFQSLSKPNHQVGAATSQFAVNTQQGTACFAALNTLACRNLALVRVTTAAAAAAATANSKGNEQSDETKEAPRRPILIVHAVTNDGGVPVGAMETDSTNSNDTNADNDAQVEAAAAPTMMGVAIHPRTVIVAEAHAHASIVQQSVSIPNAALFGSDVDDEAVWHRPVLVNGYTQILIHDHANVTHTYVEESGGLPVRGTEQSSSSWKDNDDEPHPRVTEAQRPALQNTVLETLDVHCAGAESSYTGTVLGMGGNGRTRLATAISLLHPTAQCSWSGLSLVSGACRTEMKTTLHHIADHTTSRQLHKTLVGGRATSSFRGRIRVEQSAQQTNAQQLSRTVLLTDTCRAWTVPSLEIIADDVQCTHGATVSDLSEEELFYLRSRGLDITAARNLLMYAFGNDVLNQVPAAVLGRLSLDKNDETSLNGGGGLQGRILQRLENMVPTGERAIQGEYQSV
jgi:Fe-S cluster assembly scaffold protein SufB